MNTIGDIIAIGGGGFGRNPKHNLIEKYREEQYSDISLQMMNTQIFQIESQLEILKQKQSVLIKNH